MRRIGFFLLALITVTGCAAGSVTTSDVKSEEKATADRIRAAGGVPPADQRGKE